MKEIKYYCDRCDEHVVIERDLYTVNFEADGDTVELCTECYDLIKQSIENKGAQVVDKTQETN